VGLAIHDFLYLMRLAPPEQGKLLALQIIADAVSDALHFSLRGPFVIDITDKC
jgi:hypothetical protein